MEQEVFLQEKFNLFSYINIIKNLFFRHNNLFIALFSAKLNKNHISISKNVILKHCKFELYGTGNSIFIGENCNISGLRIYCNSGKNKLIIGKNTIVNASKNQMTLFNPCNGSEIIIGENCLFSNSIEIHTTDYHKIVLNGEYTNKPQNIMIGNHCWIGLQCLILKGTILADNVVVGARSLVNKKIIESNVVVAGNPAKIIKKCANWDY